MHMSKDCQEKYLSRLIANRSIVSIYLRNGVTITGKIISATEDSIYLNTPAPQMVYKRQVNTIFPNSPNSEA